MPSLSKSGRSVVIVGAGSGLAREIALGLADRGYIVFGTASSHEEVDYLRTASRGRVSLIVCAIDNKEAVIAWAEGVSEAIGKAGVDILILNACSLASGPLELLSLDAIRHEFEVNVFGGLTVINAFLPALRTARGRIVQIGSSMASLPLPFSGPSAASHAAMEMFAAVYRAELKPFGIDVVVISHDHMLRETSCAIATLAQISAAMTAVQRKLYSKTIGAFAGRLSSTQTDEIDPAATVALMIELAEQRPAPPRVAIGRYAEQQLRAIQELSLASETLW